jgi:uncharacterized protein DUF6913
MIEAIKNKIARRILNNKYLAPKTSQADFNKFFTNAVDFILVMPADDLDFHNSMEVVKALTTSNYLLTIVVPEHKYSLLQNKSKLRPITYTKEDQNFFNLPSQKLLDEIGRKSFDILIDLNQGENLFCSALTKVIDADYKVGFSKPNADRYYNFQISGNKINSEISYRNLLNSLKMF